MPGPLNLSLQTHALDPNNAAEARLLGVLLLPYLLEPNLTPADKKSGDKGQRRLERDRRRIRLKFLGREHSRLKADGKLKELAPGIRMLLKKELAAGIGALAYGGKPKDYFPSIGPNSTPQQMDPLRRILTTGLIVLILEYMHAIEKNVPQMGLARERLYRDYQTSTLWIVNTDDTPKAWGQFMSVAHLAAAWLRLLMDKRRLANTRMAFLTLQHNYPAFLTFASHYERFLTLDKITGQKTHDYQPRESGEIALRTLLKPSQIWTLGKLAHDDKVGSITDLPREGRRTAPSSSKQ